MSQGKILWSESCHTDSQTKEKETAFFKALDLKGTAAWCLVRLRIFVCFHIRKTMYWEGGSLKNVASVHPFTGWGNQSRSHAG